MLGSGAFKKDVFCCGVLHLGYFEGEAGYFANNAVTFNNRGSLVSLQDWLRSLRNSLEEQDIEVGIISTVFMRTIDFEGNFDNEVEYQELMDFMSSVKGAAVVKDILNPNSGNKITLVSCPFINFLKAIAELCD